MMLFERFVGDLLRVRAGSTTPGEHPPRCWTVRVRRCETVKYDMFKQVLEGLKTLGLVGHQKGQSKYRKTPFGNAPEPGRAARFWATGELLRLCGFLGIRTDNVSDHFAPEPPKNPLVLKDYAVRKGKDRESR